ncbi:hypothetical protein F5Y19DRAFT_384099 [Xylariaceae sp. FL1651]|nr:hypothetical protein F5Y19DRAFT_384099 [Xylariaceae sp. FL1651]
MGLPFQCLTQLGKGTLFCAAKGTSIQTFDLSADPQALFSWSHPSSKEDENANRLTETTHEDVKNVEETDNQPPSKRRKLASDTGDATQNEEAEGGQGTPDTPANGEKKQKKNRAKGAPPKTEAPFVVLLTATDDGSHVVAVTGQDKTLWVFEHDGKGALKELSQRAMPKRPCSLAFTADGQTILSADKFGDVYALPLIPPPPQPSADESTPTPASASSTPAPQPSHSLRGANAFTVHSQRNRRALEDQQRQREANAKRDVPKEGPSFAHQLLLGHVAMLTCVLAVRDGSGRPYIITGDRDEHIRVSRGMPQAHVIETYCLGHGSFVNALCSPPSRPEILVSGGGDDELFVWDWLAGRLLGTVDLAARVRSVASDAGDIAVLKLCAYELEGGCYIVAICERAPALFVFLLQADATLSHFQTLEVPGNPLDTMVLNVTGQTPRLLAAIDPVSGEDNLHSLLVFGRSEGAWVHQGSIRDTIVTDTHLVLSREDLDKILYTVENLRKTGRDDRGDGGEEIPEQAPVQD